MDNGALHESVAGTVTFAPLPALPNEFRPFVANIRLAMASQDLRGGTVEPGGPIEASGHSTCGSYGAKATPRLLSPPGVFCISTYRTLCLEIEILVHVLTNVDCKSTSVSSYSCDASP